MFSRLFGASSPAASSPVATDAAINKSPEKFEQQEVETEQIQIELDVQQQLTGCCGLPINAKTTLYHQGILCVGTDNGAVYTYGESFQYVSPGLFSKDELIPVTHMVLVNVSHLCVVYANNNIVLFTLPSLDLVDVQDISSYLQDEEQISIVYVANKYRQYVYIVTNKNNIYVLDTGSNAVRVCDYTVTTPEYSCDTFIMSSIEISPKDEAIMAIGYRNIHDNNAGAVVFYDLKKKKYVHDVTTDVGLTAIAFGSHGDTLYLGTTTGTVMSIFVDTKSDFSLFEVWNPDSNGICVKKMTFLPPTRATSTGILFIQFASDATLQVGGECLDDSLVFIPHAIVGLADITKRSNSSTTISTVLEIPSLDSAVVDDFLIIPTIPMASSLVVPGLLLLTTNLTTGSVEFKAVQCPDKTDIADWCIEIGSLPEPRLLYELQPFYNRNISTIASLPPLSPLSSILFQNFKLQENNLVPSRANFFQYQNDSGNMWHLVLAPGLYSTQEQRQHIQRCQDIVLLGGSDGSILILGVSSQLCHDASISAFSNAWLPLKLLQPSNEPIQYINTNITNTTNTDANNTSIGEYIVVSDTLNQVYIYELYDTVHAVGVTDVYKKEKKRIEKVNQQIKIQVQLREALEKGVDDDDDDDEEEEEEEDNEEDDEDTVTSADTEAEELIFVPNDLRLLTQWQLPARVTISYLLNETSTLLMGTLDGKLYVSKGLSNKSFMEIETISRIRVSTTGAIVGIHNSSYYCRNRTVSALFILFQSGQVAVLDSSTFELISSAVASIDNQHPLFVSSASMKNKANVEPVAIMFTVDELKQIVTSKLPSEIQEQYSSPSSSSSTTPTRSPTSGDAKPSLSFMQRVSSFTSRSAPVVQVTIPPGQPRYLIAVLNKFLLTYDLSHFAVYESKQVTNSCNERLVLTTTLISNKNIISGSIVTYIDEASRAYADPVSCIACIDNDANLINLVIKTSTPSNYSYCLEGIYEKPIDVQGGSVLSSGTCYYYKCDIIFSSIPSSDKFILSKGVLPSCAVIIEGPLDEDLLLIGESDVNRLSNSSGSSDTGTRSRTVTEGEANKARIRSSSTTMSPTPENTRHKSIFSSVAAVTKFLSPKQEADLSTLYSKSKEQLNKDSLLGTHADASVRGNDSKLVTSMKNQHNLIMQNMDELRRGLEERGEKLQLMEKNAERMKEGAQDFSATSKEYRKYLEAKNNRWGLF
jgi:hypothetical protein